MRAVLRAGAAWRAMVCAVMLTWLNPGICGATETVEFHIAAQPMVSALKAFSSQSRMQLLYRQDAVKNATANAVIGNFDRKEALQQLLQGTGLEIVFSADNAATILTEAEASADTATLQKISEQLRLAQSVQLRKVSNGAGYSQDGQAGIGASDPQESVAATKRNGTATDSDTNEIGEVTVTGSHIRGVTESATPVVSYDAKAIERSGYTSVEQFLQSLSQNFRSGMTEGGGALDGSLRVNRVSGTSVNLRGLGNDSSLVLMNGRRLAPSNNGEAVDISMIPLAAVERIDILTDGASAIYGSDAVGGVVNFILRERYDGAESRVTYSWYPDGGARKRQFDQTFGKSWSSGSVMLSYANTDRNALSTSEREQTAAQSSDNAIIGMREDQALLASFTQKVGDRLDLYSNGIYMDRDFSVTENYQGFFITNRATQASQWNLGAGGKYKLSNSWQLDLGLSMGRTHTSNASKLQYFTIFVDPYSAVQDAFKTTAYEAKADGKLFAMSGGDARLAVNAQYRQDSLTSIVEYFQSAVQSAAYYDESGKRAVRAFSTELFLPLVGSRNSMAFVKRLELSLAGRIEDYDQFGSTQDPKVGLLWAPTENLSLRGTWGTSFRAPLIGELADNGQGGSGSYVVNTPAGGFANMLYVVGNNSKLTPETSSSLTFGLDYTPEFLPGSKLSLTYYELHFKDRIANPLSQNILEALFSEAQIRSHLYYRGEPGFDNYLAAYTTPPAYINGAGITNDQIDVVFDNRLANVATHRQDGLDFNFTYNHPMRIGDLFLGVAGTYIFDYGDKTSSGSPYVKTVSNVLSPTDFKFNTTLGWTQKSFTLNAQVNYLDNYRDVRLNIPADSPRDIPSWITVNLNASYELPGSNEWLSGTTLTFNVNNAFNRMAPRVYGYGSSEYDGSNADVLGRYVTLGVVKSW